MAAVLLDDVSLSLGGSWVLAHLSLRLEAGDRLLVTGANGAGKTTLLRLLATLERPQHGTLALLGAPATGAALAPLRRRLALMSHQHHFYEALSGRENLELVGRLAGVPAARQRAMLGRVGLGAHGERPLVAYSAGMKRRLVLARVLLLEPELVLLDEPYAQLDAAGAALMDEALAELSARGATLVVVSHEPARLRARCSAELHLACGRGTLRALAAPEPA